MPTVGQYLLTDALPEDLRHTFGELTKKHQEKVLQNVAEIHPDKYRDVLKKWTQIGNRAGLESGGYSFGPEHLRTDQETMKIRQEFKDKIYGILNDPSLQPDIREGKLVATSAEYSSKLTDAAMKSGLTAKNPFALQVYSGSKGKPDNYKSLIAGDTLYVDSHYKPVPFPVLSSYYEGLRPHEYVAGTFGGRLAIVLTKLGTAKGGWFGKRIANASHRLVVSELDGEEPEKDAPPRGLVVDVNDPHNEGALLAHPVGGYPRNTVLTRKVLDSLLKAGHEKMLIRSPLVGGPADGGVYGRDVGVRERGTISPVGDYVGLAAAQSIAEPATQSLISSKHCIFVHQLVRMADWSVKPIKDIKVGDMVLGSDHNGNTRPVKVLNVFDNGLRECVRTEFQYGKRNEYLILDSTPDHKILVQTKKSSCKDEVNNYVHRQLPVKHVAKNFFAIATTSFTHGDNFVHEPRALLLGLLLGDGCYTESLGLNPHISCADTKLIEELKPYLASIKLRTTRLDAGNGLMYRFSSLEGCQIPRVQSKQYQGHTFSNPAKVFLDELQILGKYAHDKVIPDICYTWDNASIAALLSGLFITDGSVYRNQTSKYPFIDFASTSYRLAEQFKELMAWRFGIHFGPINNNDYGGRKRPLYSVELARFNDVKRLRNVLTILGVKRDTYDVLIKEGQTHLDGNDYRTTKRVNKVMCYRRRKQTPLGLLPTCDIEVDHPDHLFVLANGLIVSNSGGVAGNTKGQEGFPTLDKLISIPQNFPGGAVHAQTDGVVTGVREAEQGGKYVIIDGKEHYVHPDLEVKVKAGDHIEAGDPLTDGTHNPAEIVKHKGIGEGRRLFLKIFSDTCRSANVNAHRRNVELIARGLIDHVELNQEYGSHAPGDIIPYTMLEHEWEPRDGHKVDKPKYLLNHYLEKPVLHYTIGTRITPSVVKMLEENNVDKVVAHSDAPPFEPRMLRSNDILLHDPDWMTKGLGSNVEKGLLHSAARGEYSDTDSTSFVPALAEGVNFSIKGKSVGWEPKGLELKNPYTNKM